MSYLITCYVILFHGWYDDYIYNNAPTMMFYAAAVFVLIKRLVPCGSKESPFVRIIGKYSYSILLIHWGVLHYASSRCFTSMSCPAASWEAVCLPYFSRLHCHLWEPSFWIRPSSVF